MKGAGPRCSNKSKPGSNMCGLHQNDSAEKSVAGAPPQPQINAAPLGGQCSGVTKQGAQCKKKPLSGSAMCKVHNGQKAIEEISSREEWASKVLGSNGLVVVDVYAVWW